MPAEYVGCLRFYSNLYFRAWIDGEELGTVSDFDKIGYAAPVTPESALVVLGSRRGSDGTIPSDAYDK